MQKMYATYRLKVCYGSTQHGRIRYYNYATIERANKAFLRFQVNPKVVCVYKLYGSF